MPRRAGTGASAAPSSTRELLNAGMNFDTGSVSSSFPSSYSIMSAMLVTGLVIDAMRNIVSVRIGVFAATSWNPEACTSTTLPSRAINVTMPPASLRSMKPCMPACSRASRSAETPTEAGVAAAGGATAGCWAETTKPARAIRTSARNADRIVVIGFPS